MNPVAQAIIDFFNKGSAPPKDDTSKNGPEQSSGLPHNRITLTEQTGGAAAQGDMNVPEALDYKQQHNLPWQAYDGINLAAGNAQMNANGMNINDTRRYSRLLDVINNKYFTRGRRGYTGSVLNPYTGALHQDIGSPGQLYQMPGMTEEGRQMAAQRELYSTDMQNRLATQSAYRNRPLQRDQEKFAELMRRSGATFNKNQEMDFADFYARLMNLNIKQDQMNLIMRYYSNNQTYGNMMASLMGTVAPDVASYVMGGPIAQIIKAGGSSSEIMNRIMDYHSQIMAKGLQTNIEALKKYTPEVLQSMGIGPR